NAAQGMVLVRYAVASFSHAWSQKGAVMRKIVAPDGRFSILQLLHNRFQPPGYFYRTVQPGSIVQQVFGDQVREKGCCDNNREGDKKAQPDLLLYRIMHALTTSLSNITIFSRERISTL